MAVPNYCLHNNEVIKGFFGQYRFLSNFYKTNTKILYCGNLFDSVEHAYQAAKWPQIDGLEEKFKDITANTSKEFGWKAPNFDKYKWDEIKFNIMQYLVCYKFLNDQNMRKLLIETGDRYLEETNHWGDIYWGVCNGAGKNMLGYILMDIRKIIRQY